MTTFHNTDGTVAAHEESAVFLISPTAEQQGPGSNKEVKKSTKNISLRIAIGSHCAWVVTVMIVSIAARKHNQFTWKSHSGVSAVYVWGVESGAKHTLTPPFPPQRQDTQPIHRHRTACLSGWGVGSLSMFLFFVLFFGC